MAEAFEYKDLMTARLDEEEARLNSRDPTGTAAKAIMPAKRNRALENLPKFYDPEQHANSPHVSVNIRAPAKLSLSKPFPITSTLTHHANPTGNPDNKPVVLDLADTCLNAIRDDDLYPWLIMHRTADDKLVEVDDNHDTSCPPFESEEGIHEQKSISRENGFVTLAVGESVEVTAELKYTGNGVELVKGEKYCINFRGSWLRWWRFGTFEALGGEKKVSRSELGSLRPPFVTLASSNLIACTVAE